MMQSDCVDCDTGIGGHGKIDPREINKEVLSCRSLDHVLLKCASLTRSQ